MFVGCWYFVVGCGRGNEGGVFADEEEERCFCCSYGGIKTTGGDCGGRGQRLPPQCVTWHLLVLVLVVLVLVVLVLVALLRLLVVVDEDVAGGRVAAKGVLIVDAQLTGCTMTIQS